MRLLWVAGAVLALAACPTKKKSDPAPARAEPTAAADSPPATVATALASDAGAGVSGAAFAEERAGLKGLIAFMREVDGRREAWLVPARGGRPRRLDAGGEGDVYPAAASRDGKRLVGVVAFGEEPAHVEQLIVWELPGGTARRLGPKSPRTRRPSFSPDGRTLVFESGANSFSDLYLINVDGTGLSRLTDNEEGNFEPTWSPDGKQLAFVSSRDGDPEIYRMRADGEEEERLTAFHLEDTRPIFAPGAPRLAFISNREGEDAVFVMAPDGTGQRRLVAATEQSRSRAEREPAWSPDGTKLAFVQRVGAQASSLWVADVSGGRAAGLGGGAWLDDLPAWSPDSRHLVFVSDRTGRPQLHLTRADGSAGGPLLETPGPGEAWLPVWIPEAG